MSNQPICDTIATKFANSLSFETKLKIYQDLKDQYLYQASSIMERGSIEDAIDEFTFHIFWSAQHQLMNNIMTDEEIDERVYPYS